MLKNTFQFYDDIFFPFLAFENREGKHQKEKKIVNNLKVDFSMVIIIKY